MLRKARVYFFVFYDLMLAYRGEIILWAVATALPLIMMGIWVEAAKSGDFPLSAVDMARYFIAAYIVRQFTVVWVIHDFEWNVVTGRLSPRLLHPIDPGWGFFISHLSEQAVRLPIVVLLVGLCFALFPHAFLGNAEHAAWVPAWWQVLLSLLAMYAAFVVRFMLQYAFAMLSFWVERVSAIEQVIYLPYVFMSGMLFPLEVVEAYSPLLYQIFLLTPFPYLLWLPAKILTDGNAPILQGCIVLMVWGVVFWGVARLLWRRGLKHYSAMGA